MNKKQLLTLTRLEQMKLDHLQQEIRKIRQHQQEIQADLDGLEQEKKNEQSVQTSIIYRDNEYAYFKHLDTKQGHLKDLLQKLDIDLQDLLEKLSETFYAKKRIERVKDRLEKAQKEEADRKEESIRDELSLMLYKLPQR